MDVCQPYAAATLSSLATEAPDYMAVRPIEHGDIDLSHGELRVAVPEKLIANPPFDPGATLRYGDPRGLVRLRENYARHSRSDQVDADSVLVVAGAKQALWLAFLLTLRPGALVLVPEPGWAPYRIWSGAMGAQILTYDPLRSDVVEVICERVRRGIDLVVLNFPNNPTGAELDAGAVASILDTAAEAKATVVSDEVYRHFAAGSASLLSQVGRRDVEVIVADSLSKWTAAAGLRIGFLVGRPERIEQSLALRSTIDSCPPGLTQNVACALLSDEAEEFRATLRCRSALAIQRLSGLLTSHGVHVRSAGGIFVWAQANGDEPRFLLPGHGTLVGVPGAQFRAPGMVRLCPVSDDVEVLRLLADGGRSG